MSYKKKRSSHYEKAVVRLAALKSVDPKMDLGNGQTIVIYENAITDLRKTIDQYNTHLSQADEQRNKVRESEKSLKDLSERMLAGVVNKYGRDSEAYEMAGGVKKSERKKRAKKKVA